MKTTDFREDTVYTPTMELRWARRANDVVLEWNSYSGLALQQKFLIDGIPEAFVWVDIPMMNDDNE